MRCSESLTTCTAPDMQREAPAVRVLEALLFAEVLRPLTARLGPLADVALNEATQHLFAHDLVARR